ncbi:MAG: nucleotidyl transferase AbiEii/AbiGii toxin family protein [Acidobacteria bacterium]|nr:nucleotidyl transferase AbiEii/AbiGii toxin family protein [Acidobacteriota bacterium]
MAELKLHWEATVPGMRQVYELISKALRGESFYLAGGTALALMEAHRISFDLDFFAKSIKSPAALAERLDERPLEIRVTSVAPGTLYAVANGIQVSFIATHYPLLLPAAAPGDGLIPLASRDDLGAMKLAAVASRGSRKDFVDLWILVRRHRSLQEYLELYRRKYVSHDVGHVLRSLVYFDDADSEPELQLTAPVDWRNVKADFKAWVAPLLR